MGPRTAKRSLAKITLSDLKKLARIAREDRENFFSRHPDWAKLYRNRIICVALLQGAALHYVGMKRNVPNMKKGVKDFDVWTFYRARSEKPFPYRRRGVRDFGKSKFGRHPSEKSFEGRRVDLLGRSLKVRHSDPVKAIRDYLSTPKTASARELAEKAAVLLEPEELCGTIVWPF